MKETLTCTSCGKDWKREVTRGRKPKLCKKCFKDTLTTTKPAKQIVVEESAPEQPKRRGRPPRIATVVETPPEPVAEVPKRRGRPPRVILPVEPPPSLPVPIQTSDLTLRQIWSVLVPKHARWRELVAETENGSRWQCPKCKWVLEVSVALTDIPYHKCSPAASRVQSLERID